MADFFTKLKILRQHYKSTSALVEASGISKSVLYRCLNGSKPQYLTIERIDELYSKYIKNL